MIDGLAAIVAVIHHHSIAGIREAQITGDDRHSCEKVTEEGCIFGGGVR
jgi:hypothetical protein